MRNERLAFISIVVLFSSCLQPAILALAASEGRECSTAKYDEGADRPKYDKLSIHYSKDVHNCKDITTSPNQCAVRVSRALIGAGIELDSSYSGKLCRHGYARGAQDLGAFLKKKWGTHDLGFTSPGSMPAQLKGKKGVILFIDIPTFDGQGHIDLWDGSRSKTGDHWDAKTIWFWKLN